jgi:hypothetical protein
MSDYSDSSSDASDTYAQIVVPTYDLENPVDTSGTTTGSSFIRLGSFPSLTDSTEQPSGFAHSLALAQLVAGTATTYTAGTLSEDAGPDAKDYNLLTSDTYQGDSTLFQGFADDTRYRDGALLAAGTVDSTNTATDDAYIDWTYVDNTVTNRQKETARLLFKGGWWDHSDGNRITTTCGDKIEVIQGNYKMIVLGRQAPGQGSSVLSSNAVVTDMSGGQALASCYTPGAGAVAIEYVYDDGVWTAYESGNGNMYSTYTGNQVYYNYGEVYNTFIGQDPSKSANLVKTPDKSLDPVMVSKTWAQKIETYYGSDGKPVPYMYSYTGVGAMDSVTNAGTMNSTTQVGGYNSLTIAAEITSTTVAPVGIYTNVGYALYTNVGVETALFVGPYEQISTSGEIYVTTSKLQIASLNTRLEAAAVRVFGTDTKIAEEETKLADTVAELNAAVFSLAEEVMELQEAKTTLAEDVNLISDIILMG